MNQAKKGSATKSAGVVLRLTPSVLWSAVTKFTTCAAVLQSFAKELPFWLSGKTSQFILVTSLLAKSQIGACQVTNRWTPLTRERRPDNVLLAYRLVSFFFFQKIMEAPDPSPSTIPYDDEQSLFSVSSSKEKQNRSYGKKWPCVRRLLFAVVSFSLLFL